MSDTGYFHQDYALSTSENAQVIRLELTKGTILKNTIPNSNRHDANNCYPLFCCQNWENLIKDINLLPKDLVSIRLTSDPFADINLDKFNSFFDVFYHYKDHYLVDFNLESNFSKHHRKEIKRAENKGINVEKCKNPLDYLNEWDKLYNQLIDKHSIKKNSAFSKTLFEKQFKIPRLIAFKAELNGEIIGINLFYHSKDKAYFHLAAYSKSGYKYGASYALMASSLNYLKGLNISQVTLGANAGLKNNNDGLAQFKSGWANSLKKVYFMGKILDTKKYQHLSENHQNTKFFPAYRSP